MTAARRQDVTAQAVLFDWGDTVMRVFPDEAGPMVSWRRLEVLPHFEFCARRLRASARIVLATNAGDSTEEDIWAALERAGVAGLFDAAYCLANVGRRKPTREFFEHVLADLGVEPRWAFMVGDDFAADVEGANAAGLAAVWYAPNGQPKRSGAMHRTIRTFRDLDAALTELGLEQTAG